VDKAPDAFRTISEVATELDVPQHVLRFWESRFREIKPMKRGGGRRYYRPDDVDLLRGIRYLLYGEGYTIRGVQRILKDQGTRFVQAVWQAGAPQPGALDDADTAHDDADARATAHDDARGRKLLGLLPSLLGGDNDDHMERHESPGLLGEARALPSQRLVAPALGRSGLSRDDARKLEAVLHELSECRKLIEAALDDKPPPAPPAAA
jgi:DNA-binding transcriptional MerR regulator